MGPNHPVPRLCRYSPHREDFVPVDQQTIESTINISEAGNELLYRLEGLDDDDCLSLEAHKQRVHLSPECIGKHFFLCEASILIDTLGPGKAIIGRSGEVSHVMNISDNE